MSERVMLVNPPYSGYFLSDHFSVSRSDNNQHTKMMPLGLAYLASYLRENSFVPICVDLEVKKIGFEELANDIERSCIDYVAITSSTPLMNNAISLASYLKKNTAAKTIIGGPHASAEPLETVSLDCFDIAVVGEGEETLLEIVEGKRLDKIKGVAYSDNNKVRLNEKRAPPSDLDRLAFPAIDLFPYTEYKPSSHRVLPGERGKPYFAMISSRGCPSVCNFCSSGNIHGRNVRFRSPENVVQEMKYLVDSLGANSIMFYDDTFTLDKKRTVSICKKILSEELDVVWGCNTRLDTINAELLNCLKLAGCSRIYVGAESGNDSILRTSQKGISVAGIKSGISKIKDSGLETSASYIIGLPGDTKETIGQTIASAIVNGTDFAHFYVFTPDPGSTFYDELKRRDIIKQFDWLDYGEMIKKGTHLLGENIGFSELVELVEYAYYSYYADTYNLRRTSIQVGKDDSGAPTNTQLCAE